MKNNNIIIKYFVNPLKFVLLKNKQLILTNGQSLHQQDKVGPGYGDMQIFCYNRTRILSQTSTRLTWVAQNLDYAVVGS